jgi:intein/homing endonuclease
LDLIQPIDVLVNDGSEFRYPLGGVYNGKRKILKLVCASKEIKATPEHRFLRPDMSWTQLQDLAVGDMIVLYAEGERYSAPVTSISACGVSHVYDILMDEISSEST